ncbi:MAG: RIP metalloprotease [Deltaproteobacteria bacterium]|nr:MAG: RIP metalloprotease [Deltaproteobacteria bacterium]
MRRHQLRCLWRPSLTNLLAELVALVAYAPAVVLVHELGHALMAKPGGYRVTSFGIGFGRPWFKTRLAGGVVVHVSPMVLAGGACTAIPAGPVTPKRGLFHAGGLIAQAVLAVVLFLLPSHWLIDRVLHFNALVALTNILPWRVGTSASDGWFLFDTLTGGRRGGLLLAQRKELERLAAREAAVESPVGTLWAQLCLAWIDTQVGAAERADAFFTEDPPETAVDPWIDAVYHSVRADWHRLHGRSLAALRTVRETRAARLDELSPDAEGLLTLAEARALIQLESQPVAERVLARVVGHTGPVARQAAVVRLLAAIELPTEELEFATWRVLRQAGEAWLDPAETASALWQASVKLEAHGRIDAANGARHAARTLAQRLLIRVEWSDKEALRRRLGPAAGHRPKSELAARS